MHIYKLKEWVLRVDLACTPIENVFYMKSCTLPCPRSAVGTYVHTLGT